MTQAQRKQLDRALAIAERDALTVTRGTRRDTGAPVYGVRSRTDGHYYLLTVDGGRIQCQCPAHHNGRVCAHAAAVRSAIRADQEAARQRQADAAWYREWILTEYPAPGFRGW
jgi:uncharacterized Zn finger protein